MKLGVSLSGGGVRATVFHLGVLSRLADCPRWDDIAFISTVSGGSLCAALVFQKAGKRWPSRQQYRETLPALKTLLTSYDLERAYKWRLVLRPWRLAGGRASIIATLITEQWGITAHLQDLPASPRWVIGATCYETGKNWRFCAKRMGDYLANYVVKPSFPLAHAVAASAAVPGLIGPLRVATGPYQWHRYAKDFGDDSVEDPTEPAEAIAPHLTLWDGGVYDNLGSEAIFKPSRGLRKEVDFYLASDASRPLGLEFRRVMWGLPPYLPPFRLIDTATDQVSALRRRMLVDLFSRNKNGVFIRMGNTADATWKAAGTPPPEPSTFHTCLSKTEVEAASAMPTTLRRLTQVEYDRLFRHGYEVTDATLAAYGHQVFATRDHGASSPLLYAKT